MTPSVTYTSPVRFHYGYAKELNKRGVLKAFVSGVPRVSPRSPLPELGELLVRKDWFQTAYMISVRIKTEPFSKRLAYWSKQHLDRASLAYARDSNVFLYYSGCGLQTTRALSGSRTVRIVELVSSHILNYEECLKEEAERCALPHEPAIANEVADRIAEYDEADFVLCASEFSKRTLLERGIPESKIIKNVYGVALPAQATPIIEAEKREIFRVLFVGLVNLRKGLRYLLEAFRRLKHPNKELLIVGGKTRQTGIDDVSLPEGVRFTGVLRGAALAEAYSSATVFVLPSIEDGFGLVMAEAMSFGLPVIASDNTGALDLLTPGREGFVVPIRDPEAIALRLQQLADDPDLLSTMGSAASATARTLGGWSVAGENLVNQLTRVLGA